MRRNLIGLALFGIACSVAGHGRAQTAALISVADATQLSELQLAQVMADDSSIWLSARLQGRTRLALVTSQADLEVAPKAHAWLRALDFATRVRVATPPGPIAPCGSSASFELADSGLPEPPSVPRLELASANSELELRRRLSDAALPADPDPIARFASQATPPFQIAIYDVPAFGGSTEALRLRSRAPLGELPQIGVVGADSVPLSLIALASDGVQPLSGESADPSEFPVAYRALDASTDYRAARGGWLAQNPASWLNEVRASGALFAWTVFPPSGHIEPVLSRYFGALSGAPAGSCETQVRAAHARGSQNSADFTCNGGDDLAQSLSELGFAEPRLSRFFGSARAERAVFRVAPSAPRSALLIATDVDRNGCPAQMPLPPVSQPSDPRTQPPGGNSPSVSSPPDEPDRPTPVETPAPASEGSCTVSGVDSGPNESCSGDSSSSDASDDSCSGDSSSDDSGPDSCTGDSSDSSSDSCGGDSDSSGDSSGCGKSEYDGDTCSGSSAHGSSARASAPGPRMSPASARPRPRQVRLSLLTLLAAAMALPLRRLRASR